MPRQGRPQQRHKGTRAAPRETRRGGSRAGGRQPPDLRRPGAACQCSPCTRRCRARRGGAFQHWLRSRPDQSTTLHSTNSNPVDKRALDLRWWVAGGRGERTRWVGGAAGGVGQGMAGRQGGEGEQAATQGTPPAPLAGSCYPPPLHMHLKAHAPSSRPPRSTQTPCPQPLTAVLATVLAAPVTASATLPATLLTCAAGRGRGQDAGQVRDGCGDRAGRQSLAAGRGRRSVAAALGGGGRRGGKAARRLHGAPRCPTHRIADGVEEARREQVPRRPGAARRALRPERSGDQASCVLRSPGLAIGTWVGAGRAVPMRVAGNAEPRGAARAQHTRALTGCPGTAGLRPAALRARVGGNPDSGTRRAMLLAQWRRRRVLPPYTSAGGSGAATPGPPVRSRVLCRQSFHTCYRSH